eukprot:765442-Hanusia_phi.AAC.2
MTQTPVVATSTIHQISTSHLTYPTADRHSDVLPACSTLIPSGDGKRCLSHLNSIVQGQEQAHLWCSSLPGSFSAFSSQLIAPAMSPWEEVLSPDRTCRGDVRREERREEKRRGEERRGEKRRGEERRGEVRRGEVR